MSYNNGRFASEEGPWMRMFEIAFTSTQTAPLYFYLLFERYLYVTLVLSVA
jgi:hypothetical protein